MKTTHCILPNNFYMLKFSTNVNFLQLMKRVLNTFSRFIRASQILASISAHSMLQEKKNQEIESGPPASTLAAGSLRYPLQIM